MAEVPEFDIMVDADDLNNRKNVVNQVLAKLGKDWKPEDVKIEDVDGGQANRMLRCYTRSIDDGILFRVTRDRFPTFTNLERNFTIYRLMDDIGVGPNVLCRLRNGICYEYIMGKSFSMKNFPVEFRDLTVTKLVAKELAKIHSKKTKSLALEKYNMTPENSKWGIFEWLLDEYEKPMMEEEAQQIKDSPAFPTKAEFLAEKQEIEEVVSGLGFDRVFSHNDAYFGNVIHNEEKGTAMIVDYDVCSYNNQGFDIANFPIASAVGYLAIDRRGEKRSLNTPEFYREYLWSYLEKLSEVDEWGRDITEKDVERMYVKIQKMTLYCILYLVTICVLVGTKPALRPGQGPRQVMDAGRDLWRLYRELKNEVLALEIPSAD
ncbi:ethanolamine kinase 1-like [Lineus longissimus]|uniref:ethanolamine kinase 1-like n=1 Tax=Lineus longissimus TaxID=88925 RepID=UPI002B4D5AC8